MKSILTILFVLLIGASALANTGKRVSEFNPQIESYVQTTPTQMDIVLVSGLNVTADTIKDEITNEKSVARLYKFKNSRIKKALAFRTKRNKAKMA